MSDIEWQNLDGSSILLAETVDLARYVTERDAPALESPRPYFHPMRTLGGKVVSGYRPNDHDWHWGLSMAIANIDVPGEELPVNLWGGVTYTGDGYEQLDNNGDQVHEGWDEAGVEQLTWRTASGRPFLAETRRLKARVVTLGVGAGAGASTDASTDASAGAAGHSAWRLDVTSEWTNLTDGTVRFGSPTTAGRDNAGYGGWFLRVAPEFSTATVLSPDGPVDVGSAMGTRPTWLALNTDAATVALAADKRNPVPNSPFFVRTETPMLCAAPFFFEKWPLEPGATATWRWSLVIADGRLDATSINEAFAVTT
jgi:hypothetical protein